MITYNDLYLDIRRRLRAGGVEAASLEAREIMCHAAEKSREQLYRDLPFYTCEGIHVRAEELLKRRLQGEPVAYLIGEWEFYGLPLDITPDVLIPRADTEVLAARAIERARAAGPGARVLDLCAGSGCVGLAVAHNVPECRTVLADLSGSALSLCRRNVRRNQLSTRATCLVADARRSPPSALGSFSVIACNPPYIPTKELAGLDISVRGYEPLLALNGGEDGLDFYRHICAKWRGALRPGGYLIFEVGTGQAPEVERILAENGFSDIDTIRDSAGIWRVVEGRSVN